jgi:hypothetical protein
MSWVMTPHGLVLRCWNPSIRKHGTLTKENDKPNFQTSQKQQNRILLDTLPVAVLINKFSFNVTQYKL